MNGWKPSSVFNLEIGGMTAQAMEKALDREICICISSDGRSMLKNKKQFIHPVNKRHREAEILALVRLRVRDLGFTKNPTTKKLLARAKALGLDLCPPEVGPYLRLADKDQPPGWYYIGMEPVAVTVGHPNVFSLGRDGDELWLNGDWAHTSRQWSRDHQFVFSARKVENFH